MQRGTQRDSDVACLSPLTAVILEGGKAAIAGPLADEETNSQ